MRKFILLLMFALYACPNQAQQQDPALFGSWQGSEKDGQRKGLEKHWVMHRFEDGTFVLLFTTLEDGEIESFSEKGKWWIENGKFHEYHNNSKLTDVYDYNLIDSNHVKFKAISLAMHMEDNNYEFIDTKIPDTNL